LARVGSGVGRLFIQAGFSNIQSWAFDPTIANPDRQWASLYVIATK
jgi:hypothetical protein